MINYDRYEFSILYKWNPNSQIIHFVLHNVFCCGAFDDLEESNVSTVSLVVIFELPSLPFQTSTKSDGSKLRELFATAYAVSHLFPVLWMRMNEMQQEKPDICKYVCGR